MEEEKRFTVEIKNEGAHVEASNLSSIEALVVASLTLKSLDEEVAKDGRHEKGELTEIATSLSKMPDEFITSLLDKNKIGLLSMLAMAMSNLGGKL